MESPKRVGGTPRCVRKYNLQIFYKARKLKFSVFGGVERILGDFHRISRISTVRHTLLVLLLVLKNFFRKSGKKNLETIPKHTRNAPVAVRYPTGTPISNFFTTRKFRFSVLGRLLGWAGDCAGECLGPDLDFFHQI